MGSNDLNDIIGELRLIATFYFIWWQRNKRILVEESREIGVVLRLIKTTIREKASEFTKIKRTRENEFIKQSWALLNCMFK